MTRQNFLRLALSFSITGGTLLAGCGGGSSSGGSNSAIPTRSVQGTLAVPEGFALAPSALRVETGLGGGSVAADGSFSLSVNAAIPTLAWVRTADNVLLTGFLSDSGGTISVRSTAVTLLYFALGGQNLPSENTSHLLPLLDAHAAVEPLAAALARQLVANPSAIADEDAEIGAALKVAVDAVLAGRPAPSRAQRLDKSRATRAVTSALLSTSPTGLQSNVELLQGSAPQTITLTNHARRYCQVYLYEIGKEGKDGVKTTYPAAKKLSKTFLNSTAAIGYTSTITGFYSGQTALVPVVTKPIPLSMAEDAKQTFFEAVVLGSSSLLGDPPIYSEPRYAAEVAAWREDRLLLNLTSWFYDVVFGLFLEIWGLRNVQIDFAGIQEAVTTLRNIQIQSWGEVAIAVTAGDFTLATSLFLKLCRKDTAFFLLLAGILVKLSPAFKEILSKEAIVASGQLVTKFFAGIFAPSNVASILLGAGDLAAVLWDLAHSEQADRWQASLLTGDVILSPASITLAPGGSQNFTASVPALPTANNLRYQWDVTGSDLVSIGDAKEGKGGKSFETSGATVNLATTPSTQGTLILTVEAFEIGSGGERISHGKAAASVTMDPNAPPVNPGEMKVKITNLLNHGIGVPTGDEYLKEYTLALTRPVDYYPQKGLGYNPKFGFSPIAFFTKYGDNNEFQAGTIGIPAGTDPAKNSYTAPIDLTLLYPTNIRGGYDIACDAQTLTTTVSGNRVDFQLSGRFYQYVSSPNRENLGYTANVEITGFFYYETQFEFGGG